MGEILRFPSDSPARLKGPSGEDSWRRDRALYAQSLQELTVFSDARRIRLFRSRDAIPPILWAVLILGGIITVSFRFLFRVQNILSQTAITVALTTSIALLLFVIFVFDHPFKGDIRVDPFPFERALRVIETELSGAAGRARP